MITPFRAHLAARSAAYILEMILLVGLLLSYFLSARVRRREEAGQREHIVHLLDTVERTAQIACFVGDAKLAEEVAAGLQENPVVGRVTLVAASRSLVDRKRQMNATLAGSRGQPYFLGLERERRWCVGVRRNGGHCLGHRRGAG